MCHAAHYWGVDRSMHCICMAYGCELQVGTMFVVLCIPLYYYQPREFLCSGTDAPMCSLLHLLHVPCSAMYKCFGVWLCLPVQCYGPLFSWSIQLPLGFVCSAHVGGHNPGTLGGVGLVVSWYTRVRKSSSCFSPWRRGSVAHHHRPQLVHTCNKIIIIKYTVSGPSNI